MIYIAKALQNLRPGAVWVLSGETLSHIEWKDTEQKQPSDKQIMDEVERIKQEEAAQEYISLRISEYPSIGDQLDALFKAGVFPEEMAAQIQAVKDKYPKG